MPTTFPIQNSSITVNENGFFTMTGTFGGPIPTPPIEEPPTSTTADMIDLGAAVITSQSPDVRSWPIGSKLTSLTLSFDEKGNNVAFDKMFGSGAWPFVNGPEGGEIQYTLWVGLKRDGVWLLTGSILCISRGPGDNYFPTGPTLQPGQMPNNWYYYVPELAGYQPQPGEQVAWFLTSGVQRRNDIRVIAERTQVVVVPFLPGTFHF